MRGSLGFLRAYYAPTGSIGGPLHCRQDGAQAQGPGELVLALRAAPPLLAVQALAGASPLTGLLKVCLRRLSTEPGPAGTDALPWPPAERTPCRDVAHSRCSVRRVHPHAEPLQPCPHSTGGLATPVGRVGDTPVGSPWPPATSCSAQSPRVQPRSQCAPYPEKPEVEPPGTQDPSSGHRGYS